MLHTGYNTNMQEEWRSVIGYEGLYEVSSFGRVRSIKRQGTEGKIKNTQSLKKGYLHTCLYKGNEVKCVYIHRLVGKSFIPNIENKPCINHLDNNPKNNKVENLEWVTHKENNDYIISQGRRNLSFQARSLNALQQRKLSYHHHFA